VSNFTGHVAYLRPAGRGVTMAAPAGLLLEEDGVAAATAVGVAAALALVTSVSKAAHEAIPSLLPSWLTANDSQWSARSLADSENRWQRETPGWWVGERGVERAVMRARELF